MIKQDIQLSQFSNYNWFWGRNLLYPGDGSVAETEPAPQAQQCSVPCWITRTLFLLPACPWLLCQDEPWMVSLRKKQAQTSAWAHRAADGLFISWLKNRSQHSRVSLKLHISCLLLFPNFLLSLKDRTKGFTLLLSLFFVCVKLTVLETALPLI